MIKTFERNGRSGKIIYVVTFNRTGAPVMASSFYNKEDGFGGIEECVRRVDPNGPTIRKLIKES